VRGRTRRRPAVQPDGTVTVPYSANQSAIRAFRSTDGGGSWSSTVAVASSTDHPPTGMRTEPLPSAEMDASGKVYVVGNDCRFRSGCPANDIVMSTSTNGIAWSPVTRILVDAVPRGVDHFTRGGPHHLGQHHQARPVLLLLPDYYFYPVASCSTSTCQLEVGFVSSTSGGSTWSVPQTLAGPMQLSWLAQAGGAMVGDYISCSVISGRAVSVFATATAPGSTPVGDRAGGLAGWRAGGLAGNRIAGACTPFSCYLCFVFVGPARTRGDRVLAVGYGPRVTGVGDRPLGRVSGVSVERPPALEDVPSDAPGWPFRVTGSRPKTRPACRGESKVTGPPT
jgi:hypothetical protein